MKRNIIISVLVVLLIGISTIMGTYAVIINVVSENGVDRIVNTIDIRDLLSDNNGNYNNTYYDVRNELNITDMEMDILMDSKYLNDSLKIVLNNVVGYKLRGGNKLSNDNIYDMIVNDVNSDSSINNELKNKVININTGDAFVENSKPIVIYDNGNDVTKDAKISVVVKFDTNTVTVTESNPISKIINTSKSGTYRIEYTLDYHDYHDKYTLTVNVK